MDQFRGPPAGYSMAQLSRTCVPVHQLPVHQLPPWLRDLVLTRANLFQRLLLPVLCTIQACSSFPAPSFCSPKMQEKSSCSESGSRDTASSHLPAGKGLGSFSTLVGQEGHGSLSFFCQFPSRDTIITLNVSVFDNHCLSSLKSHLLLLSPPARGL